MNESTLLQPIIGSGGDPSDVIITRPAAGWKQAPRHVVTRLINRIRAGIVMSDHEFVRLGASPGLRTRLPRARRTLLAGAAYVVPPEASPLCMWRINHGFSPTDYLRTGSGGGLRQVGTYVDDPAMLRLGVVGSSGDPHNHFRALGLVNRPKIPAPIGTGVVDGIRWTVEGFVQGVPPKHPSDEQIDSATRFLIDLPAGSDPISSIRNAVARLSAAPTGFDLNRVGDAIETGLAKIPAVVTHGDFWGGNLLFENGLLTGVVDWDSWEPAGVPGTDLIHLHAERVRRKIGMSYWDMVMTSFWRQDPVMSSVVGYLKGRRLPHHNQLLDVIGHAWWLTTAAGALHRSPTLAKNQQWMSKNVQLPGGFIAERAT